MRRQHHLKMADPTANFDDVFGVALQQGYKIEAIFFGDTLTGPIPDQHCSKKCSSLALPLEGARS
jgi:hypothetical protein